jgi:hypothetical protein
MKRIFSLAAILLLTVAFMGCGIEKTAQPTEEPSAPEETSQTPLDVNQVAFGIEGMT